MGTSSRAERGFTVRRQSPSDLHMYAHREHRQLGVIHKTEVKYTYKQRNRLTF